MSFKNFVLSKIFFKNLGVAVSIIVVMIMLLLIWLNFYTRHGQARPVPDFFGLTMEQTAKLAKKSRLKYQVIDSIYTTIVPRGCVAEQNPKPGFKVKKWRNVVLTINAFKPEMVAVPNLVDLPIRQALALVESSGLKMGDPRYRPDLSVNIVLEQLFNGKKIIQGDSLQKGSVIDLILGKGLSNQRTSVPDLMGMNLEPAKNKILVSTLSLGTYVYDNTIRHGEDTIKAFVYKQNPEYKEDASLQLGSAIYLWLTVDSAKLPVDSTLLNLSDTIPAPDSLNKPPDKP
ncbi:MAG: PASTA domain-containing protein [Bacteroidetes bacterium]|nr:MAG: PASTA domain-containing protein [Bacteroidota bacterium]